MKKIFVTIRGRTYLIGFSSSLLSYLTAHQDNIDYKNAVVNMDENTSHTEAYHNGHRSMVMYSSSSIVENEQCWYAHQ